MGDNIKPRCAGPDHARCGEDSWPQIEVKVTELPYNPEWPARTVDAAVFCTYQCLTDWANDRTVNREHPPTGDQF